MGGFLPLLRAFIAALGGGIGVARIIGTAERKASPRFMGALRVKGVRRIIGSPATAGGHAA
ncbi:hypothetical protein AZ21_1679 [Bordetella bronchiseptica B20-10725633]|nr:hypothetical protein AZ21_1679 [Bordetella bronchiseptica B20-10725633]